MMMDNEFDKALENSFDVVPMDEIQDLSDVSSSIDEKLKDLDRPENGGGETINITNNTLNVFSSDLATADNNAEKSVGENPEFSYMVNKVVDEYNEKYGTKVSYDDFNSYLLERAKKTEKEKRVEDVVREEIAKEAIGHLENKYLLVMAKFLDAQMNQMLRSDIMNDIGEINLALIDRLLMMRKELDKLSSRYKGNGDIKSRLDNVRGKDTNQFDENTMKLINLLKESTIKQYENNDKKAPF